MIGRDDWPFTRVHEMAADRGMRLTAVYGSTLNEGSTDRALDRILANFKQVRLVLNDRMYSFSSELQTTTVTNVHITFRNTLASDERDF